MANLTVELEAKKAELDEVGLRKGRERRNGIAGQWRTGVFRKAAFAPRSAASAASV